VLDGLGVEAAADLGVEHLTLFGFSTENWRRPPEEIDALFDLMRRYVNADLERLVRDGVRVRIVGSRTGLQPDLVEIIERAERMTALNDRFNLTIAFNYGGRGELLRAAQRAARRCLEPGQPPEAIDEAMFEDCLDTRGLPHPDLLIRTSGERRISNFLLWQTAYSEFVFLDVLWPDFNADHLARALEEYRGRERRFGGVVNG